MNQQSFLRTTTLNIVGTILLGTGFGAPASAQNAGADPGDTQVFDVRYFDVFVPRSALDMLARIPGYQLSLPDDRRGLGQGGANVLLNGERLIGKGDSAAEQLERISASSVTRITIIDGGTSGVPGLSGPVANITTQTSEFSGRWDWRPALQRGSEPNYTRGSLNLSGSTGIMSYTVGFEHDPNQFAIRGQEVRTRFPSNEFNTAIEKNSGESSGPKFSAGIKLTPNDDVVANVELEYSDLDINGEISGDVEMPLWKGSAKLFSFYSFRDDIRSSTLQRTSSIGERDSTRFESDNLTTEFILRAEYDGPRSKDRSWQLAGEYARNMLSSESRFFDQTADNPFIAVPLDNPNTEVDEDRWEATLTHNWKLNEKWDFQSALGAEYSILSLSGSVNENTRRFFRPKGFGLLTYAPSKTLLITGKIERDVGQLNFFDFASSVNLENNFDQTGNPDLVPQQLWRYEMDTSWTLNSGHSMNLTLFAEDIEDVVDRVAIGDSGDAIGNIDSARRYGFDFVGTLKGEAFGWDGVQLDFELEAATSSVTDPIAQFDRRLNGVTKQRWASLPRSSY